MTDPSVALPPPTVPGLSGLTVLARGGYATVYRAVQDSVARDVAVKVENRTLENERDQRRFLREARAAGRMSSHPHVVDLFDAGVTTVGHPYLIMELCDGSYAERMKTSPLDAAEARDVGVKIADALADAHALGVLHRDVKPANILITRFGEPALADFGLAVLAEARDQSVTLDVLTPAYAPPELFRHAPPNSAVDVYALCAALYTVMRGRPPRWNEDRNPSLVSLMELFDEPIPDLPGVPRELTDVLRAGMANDPAARPSAAQLRDLLAATLIPGAPPPLPLADHGVPPHHHPAPPPIPPPPPVQPPPVAHHAAAPPSSHHSTIQPSHQDPRTPAVQHQPTPTGGPGAAANRAGSASAAPWPSHVDLPTRPSGRRWQLIAAMAGGVAVLALLVSTGVWYAGRGRPSTDPTGEPTAIAQSSDPGTPGSVGPSAPGPSRSAGGQAGACLLAEFNAGASCPSQPECFDGLVTNGGVARAAHRPCDQQHTWETFALGTLPAAATGVAYQTVKNDSAVKRLCTQVNLLTVTLDDVGWQVEVLPPTPEEFTKGDRSFRCLGGKGPNRLTGPTLHVGGG